MQLFSLPLLALSSDLVLYLSCYIISAALRNMTYSSITDIALNCRAVQRRLCDANLTPVAHELSEPEWGSPLRVVSYDDINILVLGISKTDVFFPAFLQLSMIHSRTVAFLRIDLSSAAHYIRVSRNLYSFAFCPLNSIAEATRSRPLDTCSLRQAVR